MFGTLDAPSKRIFNQTVKFAYDNSLFPSSEYHGDIHWRAVASQGLWLCDELNLPLEARTIALYFGLLHDSRRENENYDPEHGLRAAQDLHHSPVASKLSASILQTLNDSLIDHDTGKVTYATFEGIGWDADRSLLGRVGMDPEIEYFSLATDENLFDRFIERGEKLHFEAPTWDDNFEHAYA
jgi:uncharacterized protein